MRKIWSNYKFSEVSPPTNGTLWGLLTVCEHSKDLDTGQPLRGPLMDRSLTLTCGACKYVWIQTLHQIKDHAQVWTSKDLNKAVNQIRMELFWDDLDRWPWLSDKVVTVCEQSEHQVETFFWYVWLAGWWPLPLRQGCKAHKQWITVTEVHP